MVDHINTSDTVVAENPETPGSPALDASADLASAATFASAESREILNLLGESEGGSCCGGSCCSA
jgi:hypothetical protein